MGGLEGRGRQAVTASQTPQEALDYRVDPGAQEET